MKKIAIFMMMIILSGCSSADKLSDKDVKMIQEKPWVRPMEEYSEELILDKKGAFYYYDSTSGNAVDDYDLCDSYTIDQQKKEVHLHCDGSELVDTIGIKKVSKQELVLDFAGKERKFTPKNK